MYMLAMFAGKLGDRYGARCMLIVCAVSATVAHFLLGMAGWLGWTLVVMSRFAACGQDVRGGYVTTRSALWVLMWLMWVSYR